jgi:hypothetical protein
MSPTTFMLLPIEVRAFFISAATLTEYTVRVKPSRGLFVNREPLIVNATKACLPFNE